MMRSEPISRRPDWRTVVCVASGPSRTAEESAAIRAAREADRCRVIAINREWESIPNADVLYAGDWSFWQKYVDRICREFDGCRWTCTEKAAATFPLCFIDGRGRPGLSRDPSVIHTGSNSGYAAINLAHHFGARRILLVGYDMSLGPKGEHHHFGDHEKGLRQAADPSKWVGNFTQLAADLAAEGVSVINCSGATALHQFERRDLADALADVALEPA